MEPSYQVLEKVGRNNGLAMDRRKFLKSIGKVVAGCVIVPSVVQSKNNLKDWKVEVAPYDGRGNSDNIEIVKEIDLCSTQNLYIYYDFTEKVEITYKIDGDAITIIKYEKFTEHPFCSFGETQEKIDSGEITYMIQKKIRSFDN